MEAHHHVNGTDPGRNSRGRRKKLGILLLKTLFAGGGGECGCVGGGRERKTLCVLCASNNVCANLWQRVTSTCSFVLYFIFIIFFAGKKQEAIGKETSVLCSVFHGMFTFFYSFITFLMQCTNRKEKILVSYIWEHPFLGQSQASINPSIDNLCNSDFSGPNLDQICSTLCDAQTQKGQQLNRFYIRQIKQNVVLYESFLWLMIQVRILEYQGKLDLSGPTFLKCPSIF